jgi:hypothetical protein
VAHREEPEALAHELFFHQTTRMSSLLTAGAASFPEDRASPDRLRGFHGRSGAGGSFSMQEQGGAHRSSPLSSIQHSTFNIQHSTFNNHKS